MVNPVHGYHERNTSTWILILTKIMIIDESDDIKENHDNDDVNENHINNDL